MSNFKLDIFTPNGIVVRSLKCDSLLIPTVKGQINVLKGHTHIVTELATGVLTAKTDMGDRHFSMTAGLCKVLGDTVTLLSTTSEKHDEIDIERAKSAQAKALSRLQGEKSLTDVEFIKFQRKLERAKMRIHLANLK